jgi:NADPH-dependent 2,4-dienoyl-CoA reductase/sulfur reductase-like enzyme
MNRRDAIKLGLFSGTVALTSLHGAQSEKNPTKTVNKIGNRKRVVVIGGGFAGLSVAKTIKTQNKDAEVLVFDAKNVFASCPYSNFWLTQNKPASYDELLFSSHIPASKYGYEVINQTVIAIDRENKRVSTLSNEYEYSLLVVATGIEYDYTPYGLDKTQAQKVFTLYPPSYSGGAEQLSLYQKIQSFKKGVFVITVPPKSYRCPPAPYERASLLANYFKNNNLDAKVVLLDPRMKPTTKAKGFLEAFKKVQSHLEYLPSSNIEYIDSESKTISLQRFDIVQKKFTVQKLEFDDANIIPANVASPLLRQSGLDTTQEGWGKVTEPGFQSINDDAVYIVGDVLGQYPFPKSAQMAHSMGLIVGEQIANRLKGNDQKIGSLLPSNVCYSFVEADKAIAVSHQTYLKEEKVTVSAQLYEDADKATADATKAWYRGITQSIFE